MEYLKKPKPPNFNKIPANITLPAVGASQWASGNHIWKGTKGILTANERKNANQHSFSETGSIIIVFNNKKSVVPNLKNKNKIDKNMINELSKVYKKSRYADRILLSREP